MKKLIILIFIFGLFSCNHIPSGREIAEQSQKRMSQTAASAVPIPEVSYFQEKRTIAKWAERWDKPDVPVYVYLVSFGKVIGYYIADGKPASTRSYILPEDEIKRTTQAEHVVSAPDIDGTYGDNNPGIRFFTANGTAVEWAGDGASYLYSDAPISFGYDVPRLGGNLKK